MAKDTPATPTTGLNVWREIPLFGTTRLGNEMRETLLRGQEFEVPFSRIRKDGEKEDELVKRVLAMAKYQYRKHHAAVFPNSTFQYKREATGVLIRAVVK